MSKIGDFRFPDIALSDAIKVAELVIRQFRGAITTSGLAEALGMAERGGGFLHKMAAMRDYGLMEGRGELRTTALAESIVLPDISGESSKAAVEAFTRVELFGKLDERLGDEIPDAERFAIILGEITRDRINARRRARTIRRYYADYVNYLRAAHASGIWDESRDAQQTPAESQARRVPRPEGSRAPIELKAGNMHLSLPRSVASIDIIESALRVLRQELAQEDPDEGKDQEKLN